jgi:hypothetical protein
MKFDRDEIARSLSTSNKCRWIPPSTVARREALTQEAKDELTFRKVCVIIAFHFMPLTLEGVCCNYLLHLISSAGAWHLEQTNPGEIQKIK